ncbi:MAG: hypothetical protein AAB610_00495 [Patescibacteria group bacterium]
MKTLLLAALALMLFVADAQASRQAPCFLYFSFETWQLEPYYPPIAESTNAAAFIPHEKTAEQEFWASVYFIDDFDSHRIIRIFILFCLVLVCDKIKLGRKQLEK